MAEQSVPAILAADDAEHRDNSATESSVEDVASTTSSMATSIMEYRRENGRTYHSYKDGKYHFPNDETEAQRLDLQHHIFYLTLNGKLGLAPPAVDPAHAPARVLDLGTGTGNWAIDFGDEHPSSEIIGIDLSPIQPSYTPTNVSFQIDDFEEDWTFSTPFDYIHSRMNNSSIADWNKYLQQCFTHLKPGGFIELQEFDLPLSDDGTLKPTHALYQSMEHLREAAAKLDHAFVDISTLKSRLEAAGFVDVQVSPNKWPSNTWAKDKKYKEIGAWNHENIASGISGFLMAALTRGLGWSKEQVDVLAAETKKDLLNRNIHAYWPISTVFARKPE